MKEILERLLCVKSIVAILLTIAFVIMCCIGALDERFITIYAIVISFYFGQQAGNDAIEAFFKQSDLDMTGEENGDGK